VAVNTFYTGIDHFYIGLIKIKSKPDKYRKKNDSYNNSDESMHYFTTFFINLLTAGLNAIDRRKEKTKGLFSLTTYRYAVSQDVSMAAPEQHQV
jgi:hypothetical protein